MQRQAYWMWYPGDFEIYHGLKLNCRREERAFRWPAFWRLDDCWHNVRFRKTVTLARPETIRVLGNGVGHVKIGRGQYPYGEEIRLEPGTHTVEVLAAKTDGLPCVYVQGDAFAGGSGWEADHLVSQWVPAGYSAMYPETGDDPEVFCFAYERIEPVAREERGGGTLYDFGRETFAQLQFSALTAGEELPVYYGESAAEALDTGECYLCDRVPADAVAHTLPARAFRYLFVPRTGRTFALSGRYEYLPLERRGSFRCSDGRLNEIWDVAAYTFHLNSREFFLDGIKRDRWVWAGDAYQSYLINYYLFFDADIVKRTTYTLRGKDPVEQHINTILDYSLYWVIGVGDYYRFTGDRAFVLAIWPRMKSLLDFCLERRNGDGFIVGMENDWVFVDWHLPMDKTGAVCAEQMLLVKALETAAACAALAGQRQTPYGELAEELRGRINRFYWHEGKGAYIDSYQSGKENVTRHANLFAILFGIADGGQRERILSGVINNGEIPPITTPYFKFYELEALCATGQTGKAREAMGAYWGGMLELGATTIWEEFDPAMEGDAHYAMYGRKYHKSLCHAWGASPIYLLGRYFLGVRPTSDAYATFECAPDPGGLGWMEGTVPLPDGSVQVRLRDGLLRVTADRAGGTLLWKGRRHALPAGKPVEIAV